MPNSIGFLVKTTPYKMLKINVELYYKYILSNVKNCKQFAIKFIMVNKEK